MVALPSYSILLSILLAVAHDRKNELPDKNGMAEMFSHVVGQSSPERSLGLLVTYSRAEACEVVWTSAEDASRATSKGDASGPCSWEEAMKQTEDQVEKLSLHLAGCPLDKVNERDIWSTWLEQLPIDNFKIDTI